MPGPIVAGPLARRRARRGRSENTSELHDGAAGEGRRSLPGPRETLKLAAHGAGHQRTHEGQAEENGSKPENGKERAHNVHEHSPCGPKPRRVAPSTSIDAFAAEPLVFVDLACRLATLQAVSPNAAMALACPATAL